MHALVTGANGFVGSAIVRKLLADGHDVRALVRENSDCQNIATLPIECVRGDIRNPAALKKAMAGCRTLFHVAADYRLWTLHPDAMYAANVQGSRNVMLAAAEAGMERIVYTSSVATLGLHPDGTISDEQSTASLDDMIGHYKRSKYLAEHEVQTCMADMDLPVVIVNPSTPVGPRDAKPTPTGQMILQAARGKMPAYVDTGLNVVHVDDVAAGHLLACESGKIGERYILGGENLMLNVIFEQLAALTGHKPPTMKLAPDLLLPLAYIAERFARITRKQNLMLTVDGVRMARKRMFFSSEKAKRELGYAPRPAQQALQDAVRWFHAHDYC